MFFALPTKHNQDLSKNGLLISRFIPYYPAVVRSSRSVKTPVNVGASARIRGHDFRNAPQSRNQRQQGKRLGIIKAYMCVPIAANKKTVMKFLFHNVVRNSLRHFKVCRFIERPVQFQERQQDCGVGRTGVEIQLRSRSRRCTCIAQSVTARDAADYIPEGFIPGHSVSQAERIENPQACRYKILFQNPAVGQHPVDCIGFRVVGAAQSEGPLRAVRPVLKFFALLFTQNFRRSFRFAGPIPA